jgi:hypothetical protein
MGSIRVPWNPYDNGVMYMPANLKRYTNDPIEAKQLFDEIYAKRYCKTDEEAKKGYFFVMTVKAHMPSEHWNEFINMPPVFRNIDIDSSNPDVIGKVNADQINRTGVTRGKERKLTSLLDTHGEFMTFGNYYLFFLLDRCHLVIDEVKEISLFTKTDCFNKFVTTFMKRRIEAIKLGKKGKGMAQYCKMVLNSSYGFDIKNNKNYGKIKICNRKQTLMSLNRNNFLGEQMVDDDMYLVSYAPRTYKCDTCIQCGFATLDNAKFAYLIFYYGFLSKCLDMDRIHVIEGDTDSLYFAVAGHPRRGIHQGFQYVVKDKKFCRDHYYEWFPSQWYSVEDEKKLGGIAVEKEGDFLFAIAPKNYTIGTLESFEKAKLKLKGCNDKRNTHITALSYINNLTDKKVTKAENCGFHPTKIDGQQTMVKDTVNKMCITGVHTKMIVLENECCAPYINGLTSKDYSIAR